MMTLRFDLIVVIYAIDSHIIRLDCHLSMGRLEINVNPNRVTGQIFIPVLISYSAQQVSFPKHEICLIPDTAMVNVLLL